jgi:hypothetical protein
MYQIDSYALDLLAYTLILLCSVDSYALDLLAYFNSDGHIMSLELHRSGLYCSPPNLLYIHVKVD